MSQGIAASRPDEDQGADAGSFGGGLIALILLSAGFWAFLIYGGPKNNPFLVFLELMGGGVILIAVMSRSATAALAPLAYYCAIETGFRAYCPMLRYYFVEYVTALASLIALISFRGKVRVNAVFLILYMILEILDVVRLDDFSFFRSVAIFPITKFAFLILLAWEGLPVRRLAAMLRGYLIGSSTIALMILNILVTQNVRFTGSANFQLSMGMGPNQIGLILAFGCALAMILSDLTRSKVERLTCYALVFLHFFSATATFTRGATLLAAVSIVIYLAARGGGRMASAAVAGTFVVMLASAIWWVAEISEDKVYERFEKQEVSNRDVIILGGLEIFQDNPIFGIGTGRFYNASVEYDILRDTGTGTHNEILRALVEHGLIGFIFYMLFILTTLALSVSGLRTLRQRATCFIFFLLSLGSEVHSGGKLAAQGLLLALSCEAFRVVAPARAKRSPHLPDLTAIRPRPAAIPRPPFPIPPKASAPG